jgi:hypothetical protein
LDPALEVILSQHQAVYSLPLNGHNASLVEYLAPLRRLIETYQQEHITVRLFHALEAPLAAIFLALVRDYLLGDGSESLYEACGRPHTQLALINFRRKGRFRGPGPRLPAWRVDYLLGRNLSGRCRTRRRQARCLRLPSRSGDMGAMMCMTRLPQSGLGAAPSL